MLDPWNVIPSGRFAFSAQLVLLVQSVE